METHWLTTAANVIYSLELQWNSLKETATAAALGAETRTRSSIVEREVSELVAERQACSESMKAKKVENEVKIQRPTESLQVSETTVSSDKGEDTAFLGHDKEFASLGARGVASNTETAGEGGKDSKSGAETVCPTNTSRCEACGKATPFILCFQCLAKPYFGRPTFVGRIEDGSTPGHRLSGSAETREASFTRANESGLPTEESVVSKILELCFSSQQGNAELPVHNSSDSHKTVEHLGAEEEGDQIPVEVQQLGLEEWSKRGSETRPIVERGVSEPQPTSDIMERKVQNEVKCQRLSESLQVDALVSSSKGEDTASLQGDKESAGGVRVVGSPETASLRSTGEEGGKESKCGVRAVARSETNGVPLTSRHFASSPASKEPTRNAVNPSFFNPANVRTGVETVRPTSTSRCDGCGKAVPFRSGRILDGHVLCFRCVEKSQAERNHSTKIYPFHFGHPSFVGRTVDGSTRGHRLSGSAEITEATFTRANESGLPTEKSVVSKILKLCFKSKQQNAELPVDSTSDSHKTVEDLCAEEEWDQIPAELQELGFYD